MPQQLNPKVINVCTTFANYTEAFTRYLDLATTDTPPISTNSSTSTSTSTPAQALEKLDDHLSKFETVFSKSLRQLLDALNYTAATETAVFMNLCARLSMASDHINGPGTGSVGAWRDG